MGKIIKKVRKGLRSIEKKLEQKDKPTKEEIMNAINIQLEKDQAETIKTIQNYQERICLAQAVIANDKLLALRIQLGKIKPEITEHSDYWNIYALDKILHVEVNVDIKKDDLK